LHAKPDNYDGDLIFFF